MGSQAKEKKDKFVANSSSAWLGIPSSRESVTSGKRVGKARATCISPKPSTTPPPGPPTLEMELTFEISDSTDWHTTSLPKFEPLEAALRCEVCKEFYDNPVITSCSHTFCSRCIRRCISTDGKCPTCKAASQADKLLPNFAVCEIVSRFQDARPKALELARPKDNEDSDATLDSKKRKLGDTDIEDGESVRQIRSRPTRKQSKRGDGTDDMPIEVPDSEDDGDETFEPKIEGQVRCPTCKESMLEVQMWHHLDVCPGEGVTGGRKTRSSANNAFPKSLQARPKVPPPTRLPGLNYAMLKQNALVKKLQELGIPAWGKKDLLIKRHTEWMHLWNANCDALETQRKSKRELLKELDVWEKTQGGSANVPEPRIMRKDFDGKGHADTHKTQFDDLIANAKRKREAANKEKEKESSGEGRKDGAQLVDDTNIHPYEGNETALASLREKVEQANQESVHSSHSTAVPLRETKPASEEYQGIRNPLGSPSGKVPIFAHPEDPIVDVEQATTTQ